DQGISCHVECLISAEADVDVRVIDLANVTDTTRSIDVTAYLELALARPEAHRSHPAFSKLFVHTAYDAENHCLLATRRRRLDDDPDIWVAQALVTESGEDAGFEYETSREAFLGRGNDVASAPVIAGGLALSRQTGDVLDPIFAARRHVLLRPHGKERLILWTAVAASREEVLGVMASHRTAQALKRVQINAWTQSRVLLRHLSIGIEEANLFQELAAALVYPVASFRPPAAFIREAMRPQRALWGFGISGTRPIVAVTVTGSAGLPLTEQIFKAQDYWAEKGLLADVVLINAQPPSYLQDVQQSLDRLVARERTTRSTTGTASGEIVLLNSASTDAETRRGLMAAARIVLTADGTELEEQVAAHGEIKRPAPRGLLRNTMLMPCQAYCAGLSRAFLHFNGFGGFDPGNAYVIVHRQGERLPAPWINVIANSSFGARIVLPKGRLQLVQEQQGTADHLLVLSLSDR
ncbi:MAG: hypothetical protein U1E15_02475, partial [Hyphomicrobiales bacterium]